MSKALIITNFVLKVTVGISLIVIFFTYIPITVSLPQSLVDILTSSSISSIFQSISFLIPIKFLLECFFFIIILKNSSILFGAIIWVYNKIKDLG